MSSPSLNVDDILEEYSLTRATAADYIDAITHLNQTQTADEINVSRDTVNRYKNTFNNMTENERALIITTLLHEKLLKQISGQSEG